MQDLDVWEILMVRACKTPLKSVYRIKRIFGRRCALKTKYVQDTYVIDFLAGIIDRLGLCGLPQFLKKVREQQEWQARYPVRKEDPVLEAAIGVLSLATMEDLPGYRPQLVWRTYRASNPATHYGHRH